MKQLTIAAKDVRVGDTIYNSSAYHPSAAWVHVVSVTRSKGPAMTEDGRRVEMDYIILHTASFDTWKHEREGVAVRRIDNVEL